MITYANSGFRPSIFISSTCYDLRQIRADLKDFIENQLGYSAILSEFDSFPINPRAGTVENCIQVVRDCANILVLIVGGRYGYVTDCGKSITNLEYINARAKGIPIYVFADKNILSILPVWEKNPNADFSNIVDSNELFEFISSLRGNENIWMFGFESAQDIVCILRKQLGYLMYSLLKLQSKVKNEAFSPSILRLNANAFQIVVDKPFAWEYVLLGEVMKQKFMELSDLKRDLIYGVSFGNIIQLTNLKEVIEWTIKKQEEIISVTDVLRKIFLKAIPVAIGEPGEPGNPDEIVYVANRIADIYESIIRWGLDFLTISVDKEYIGLINSISIIWKSVINDLDNYCNKFEKELSKLSLVKDDSQPVGINLDLELSAPDLSDFYKELDTLTGCIQIPN
ncbi:MAG TPA: DUF4062 domain-containing protein [Ruminiclostridium sp.]|nr:DUF4062 domain-containing protein [Ruminiclostridium sp.]